MWRKAVLVFFLVSLAYGSREPLRSNLALRNTVDDQYAVAVWDASCIVKWDKDLDTRIEAPMKDGVPDIEKARLVNFRPVVIPNCYHIEIRHKK